MTTAMSISLDSMRRIESIWSISELIRPGRRFIHQQQLWLLHENVRQQQLAALEGFQLRIGRIVIHFEVDEGRRIFGVEAGEIGFVCLAGRLEGLPDCQVFAHHRCLIGSPDTEPGALEQSAGC